ncbi:sodium/glucose cotransporter 4 [Gracilinanus agilis]|uniref:sodium/glucose cotransporter 4 n=1 Tax=Gracilinanus agilis TaxID=191870 RepID=UPI001CFE56FB|nr:sodium/glucose cotransporter 4 [Gracilinanus agilis]
MTWWPIGASLMSSNVGSGLFIGLAGTGAAGGLAVGGFEWNATWLLLALGWVFVPVYIAAGVVTMPEYLKKRFGGQRIQVYMSVLSLILYIFTKISTDIFSGALFIQVALGWDLYLSTVILLVVTAIYTIAGNDPWSQGVSGDGAIGREEERNLSPGPGLSLLCPFLSRVFIVFLVVISIVWIPIIQSANSGQLFDYIQAVTSYLAPPITALFLLAIFCHRVTEPGAFWGLMFGLVVGALRMILEFSYGAPSCGEKDPRPAILKDMHYLYFALLLFGLTTAVILAVSLFTAPIPEDKLIPLTWWTRNSRAPALEGHYHTHPPRDRDPELSAQESQTEERLRDETDLKKEESPVSTQSCWQKFYFWFCGLSSTPTPILSPEEKAAMERKLTSIEETPLWRRVCDINAILLLTINIFLWGYFA